MNSLAVGEIPARIDPALVVDYDMFADPRFALPVAPAFVLFGSCALVGRR